MPIAYNESISFPNGINFYLPKTSNRILLEVKSLEKGDREGLVGYIKFGETLNKIIEVFN
jgi:hypothetical protein